ncbi:MAG: FadR/GntR family transcriptional regulator [Mycobacterium sp.]
MDEVRVMGLAPIQRSSTISESVLTRLTEEILSGRWPAERPAPSERDLALTLQVNRNAVREALKVLQHAGLLKIEHGGKTMVLDWRSHAGADMLGPLTAAGVIPVSQALTDTLWMNRRMGPDAARLCAKNASDEQLAAIAAAAEACPEAGTLEELSDADQAFFAAILDGSGNIAYRLALNTLLRGIREVSREAFLNATAQMRGDREARLKIAEALSARDGDTAYELMETLLSQVIGPPES